jgi:twinkle protein
VTLEWTLEKSRAAIVQHSAKLIVIDPWNEMDHVRPRDISLTEYTGFAIKSLKRLARRFNVHVIVAAHPAKQQRDDSGGFKMPSLYDVSDSAHWYNKPDAGMIVWRGKDRTIIRVAKSRYHDQIGKPGDIDIRFDPETNHYHAIEPEMLGGGM